MDIIIKKTDKAVGLTAAAQDNGMIVAIRLKSIIFSTP
jgi:hypothetical protein